MMPDVIAQPMIAYALACGYNVSTTYNQLKASCVISLLSICRFQGCL